MGCRPDDPTLRRLERRSDDLGDPRHDVNTPDLHGLPESVGVDEPLTWRPGVYHALLRTVSDPPTAREMADLHLNRPTER